MKRWTLIFVLVLVVLAQRWKLSTQRYELQLAEAHLDRCEQLGPQEAR